MTIASTTNNAATEMSHELRAAKLPKPPDRGAKFPASWKRLRGVYRYYPVLLIFTLWEALSLFKVVDPMFMPPLEDVARTFRRGIRFT